MTAQNAYATLAEYKSHVTARGQTATTDATDDAVIDILLEAASRYIDQETGRVFYPFIQTRYFDVPNDRELFVDNDLLAVITATTNGAALPSTEYNLMPRNFSPAYSIKITDVSAYTWTTSPNGSFEQAIEINGIWGFHDRYRDAWKVGTTLTEALDTSETAFDVTASTMFSAGQIVKIDNELFTISSTGSGLLNVVSRGDNGSTAATHDSGATVYIYQFMPALKLATLELASNAYHKRFGRSVQNNETITAAGVVLSPKDVPNSAQAFINTYKEML